MSDRQSGDEERARQAAASDEKALSERLRSLDQRLQESRRAEVQKAGTSGVGDSQGMALGLKLAAEFASGVLVGAGVGWLLDRWLGISPWGLIVFLLLGFAAGVLNVLRSVGKVAEPGIGRGRDSGGGRK